MEVLKKKSKGASVPNADQKAEDFLVKYHDAFAKHRFDVGYNAELTIKITPEHPLPVYVLGPLGTIHLHDECLIEFALFHYFNINRTLSYSKYGSPITVHRSSSSKFHFFYLHA